jgi:dTDP-4-dehydrorhamnose 3,5-epimerase
MRFTPTKLKGAYLVDLQRVEDMRGFFARSWCEQEAAQHGLEPHMVQASISFNKKKGTLRGMHYQLPPSKEAKLVRCTSGTIYDVVIDLRPNSETFLRHIGVLLNAESHQALYIPSGFAHGFQTLADNTEVFYLMSDYYAPQLSRGVRWNDPTFGIEWPDDVRTIHERDAAYTDFNPQMITELGTHADC